MSSLFFQQVLDVQAMKIFRPIYTPPPSLRNKNLEKPYIQYPLYLANSTTNQTLDLGFKSDRGVESHPAFSQPHGSSDTIRATEYSWRVKSVHHLVQKIPNYLNRISDIKIINFIFHQFQSQLSFSINISKTKNLFFHPINTSFYFQNTATFLIRPHFDAIFKPN